MEKYFNKIVLSQTEPQPSDLWMRITSDKGKELGHSLWWFTAQGWKKLFDFDTRYSVTTNYNYKASSQAYESKSIYDPESGVVTVTNAYSLYDGTRDLGNNANLVLEKGLKTHVDILQKNIDKVATDLATETSNRKSGDSALSSRIDSLSNSIGSITETMTGMSNTIQNIQGRLNALES